MTPVSDSAPPIPPRYMVSTAPVRFKRKFHLPTSTRIDPPPPSLPHTQAQTTRGEYRFFASGRLLSLAIPATRHTSERVNGQIKQIAVQINSVYKCAGAKQQTGHYSFALGRRLDTVDV